ncbi:3-hydroxyacyl-ACP dehydratase FabZ family protein [Salinimicrobium sp. TH3]|uniref:3-hydroxyacyl-ACP dehydratase FabZ family protein n=1 Tax=Salinimicrobium sp. TH3 TaxID=2997342 RepID=UPI00227439D3|nr:FabA/FabZ family ACP-dehydratase [Salinimicrobium sp. TH3]MCY2687041.1 FabA/FabZ family ACP-dehydratase [Salinimicrobium sp. TH3]
MNFESLINLLPYSEPFLFVDELEEVTEKGISGTYTFKKDAYFYRGHFKDNPVTPGVILTECMAQIGVVCLGIFLLKDRELENFGVALSNATVNYYLPVLPGEKVKVVSEKEYFRFNKLKCKVQMFNAEEKLVCRGEISGMIKAE